MDKSDQETTRHNHLVGLFIVGGFTLAAFLQRTLLGITIGLSSASLVLPGVGVMLGLGAFAVYVFVREKLGR